MQKTLKVLHNRKTYEFCKETDKRINILYGGAGSGKSWSIAQYLLLEKLYTEKDIRIVIIRKTRPALKKSAWLLIGDLLTKYELPNCEKNKADLSISVGKNQMFFVPLDDPEKLKSFEKINYIWAEEASELTRDDYLQLNLRCRGSNENPGGRNRLFFSFNPIDEQSFLKDITDNPPTDVGLNHSTYKDNGFLERDYIQQLENLKDQDATYHKIYTLGTWATPTHIIYINWDVVEEFPAGCNIGYGLDFGYNKPSALLKVGMKDAEVYEEELLYETKLTNADLIEKLKDLVPNKRKVIKADCAEPQRIKEIGGAGFNIHPCAKGAGSVKASIDRCKRYKTHITKDSVNLLKEKKGYKWKQDRNGNVLDEPVEFRDHLMASERYYLGEVQEIEEDPGLVEVGHYVF